MRQLHKSYLLSRRGTEVIKKTVLLIEDDPIIRHKTKRSFIDEGTFYIVDLSHGLGVLRWLADNPKPYMIISDWNKGGCLDLVRLANKTDINIIVTTNIYEETIKSFNQNKIVGIPVVKKPFDIFKMATLIEKYGGYYQESSSLKYVC